MPTTVVISIGSRASDSVTVSTVTTTTVSGHTNAWSVVLSATVPSTTKIGDKLTTGALDYLITNISGSTLTVVGDPFTTTTAPSVGSGATTRAFPSITTWVGGAPASLVTKDWIWKGELYKEGAGANGEWTSTADSSFAATTDATRYFLLTTAAGQSFKDNAGKLTNALRYNAANGVAVSFGNSQFLLNTNTGSSTLYVDGIQFSGGTYNSRTVNSSSGQTYLSNCILKNGQIRGFVSCVNVLAFQDYTASFWVTPGYVFGQYFRNCTLYGNNTSSAFATVSSDTAFVLKNCAVFGYTAVAATTSSFTSGSCSNNATNLSSVGFGSSNVVSLTGSSQFTSLTGGSEDFRILAGSGLINVGVRDQTYTNDLDIVGSARSLTTPTIGAWEFASTPYEARITWAEAQYQASGAPVTPTDYSEPLSRGIFRGIERGVA